MSIMRKSNRNNEIEAVVRRQAVATEFSVQSDANEALLLFQVMPCGSLEPTPLVEEAVLQLLWPVHVPLLKEEAEPVSGCGNTNNKKNNSSNNNGNSSNIIVIVRIARRHLSPRETPQ